MNTYQKVFYFNRGTHHFSSLSPSKLIYSPVWFVVKARRIQLWLLGMRIYIFSEPTISCETYENGFKKAHSAIVSSLYSVAVTIFLQ